MRPSLACLFVAAFLATAPSVFAQFLSMSSSIDGNTYTFTFNVAQRPQIPAITGAPYSGRQSSKNVQTLADGTRLTRESGMETTMYRDSAGRTRRERPALGGYPAGRKPPVTFTIVEIDDPAAGYQSLLDSVNRVAHRMPLQVRPMPEGFRTAPNAGSYGAHDG